MADVLVTGFEPFAGIADNPSKRVALALDGPDVHVEILPVGYHAAEEALTRLLPGDFAAVLLLGLAAGRNRISLERVAINFREPRRPDDRGFAPVSAPIVHAGPAAYFSTLPIDRIQHRLGDRGFVSRISLSAGAYLCNAAFYLARHQIGDLEIPCGFIHLPPTPDLGLEVRGLPLEHQIAAMRVVLDELRSRTRAAT